MDGYMDIYISGFLPLKLLSQDLVLKVKLVKSRGWRICGVGSGGVTYPWGIYSVYSVYSVYIQNIFCEIS